MRNLNPWQKGLMINGRIFDFNALLAFCHVQTASGSIPPWEVETYRFILYWLGESSEIVQYSSGTTGKSKEIRLPKQSMMVSAENTCRYFNLKEGQTALLCLPVNYIAGKMMIVRSLVGGLDLNLTQSNSHPDLSTFQSIDFAAMLPMQVMNILENAGHLGPIAKLIIGGAEISHVLEKKLLQCQTEVYATFGMAETCSHVAVRRLNGPNPEKAYHALPGIALTTDERGCLVIDAPYLPAKVITNDIVHFTEAGSFIWMGRYDNLINSGGIKIVPEEMESVIRSRIALECAVVGLPDKKLGQKLVLVLERPHQPGILPELPADFPQWFPRNRQPKDIVWVNKLPRNPAYKIDRNKVKEMLEL